MNGMNCGMTQMANRNMPQSLAVIPLLGLLALDLASRAYANEASWDVHHRIGNERMIPLVPLALALAILLAINQRFMPPSLWLWLGVLTVGAVPNVIEAYFGGGATNWVPIGWGYKATLGDFYCVAGLGGVVVCLARQSLKITKGAFDD